MKMDKLKIITRTGAWLVVMVGGIFGLFLTIMGYLADWGPGGSMEGPLWRILMNGLLSFAVGACVGVLLFRKLAKSLLGKESSRLESALRSFASVLIAGIVAFVTSWVIGYLMGKITGTIDGLSWTVVFVYTPLMSFVYSIPVSLIAAALFGVFVFLYLKEGKTI